MKRLAIVLLVFFLMAWPQPAHADPISTIIVAILGAVGVTVTASAVTTAIVTAIIGGIIGTGLSLAASAIFGNKQNSSGFSPIRSMSQRSRDIIDNVVGTVEYIPVVYGQAKIGGLKTYIEVKRSKLYQVITFCEGEVEEISEIQIDAVESTNSKFSGKLTSWTRLGKDDQTYISEFAALAPGWTERHRGRGLCYGAFEFKKDADLFPRIPVVTALIKGRKVYDPRDESTAWSNNPALCILDYLRNQRFGKGLIDEEIDFDSFSDAANYYELQNWRMNGFVITSQTILENLDEMLICCNSVLTYYGGKHRLVPMKTETPVFTFSPDNILGSIQLDRLGKKERKNRVDVNWLSPSNNWQSDLEIIFNEDYYAADNNVLLSMTLELPYVTNRQQAYYLGQIAIKQSRLNRKVSFKATQEALQVEIAEVVYLTWPNWGWTERKFRVNALALEPDGNITVTLEEYDEDVYSPDDVPEDQLGDSPEGFKNPFEISPPGVPDVTQTFIYDTIGNVKNQLNLSWAEPVSGFVESYQVEYKATADTDWIVVSRKAGTVAEIIDVPAGTYDIRLKAINTFGGASDYTSITVEVVNDTSLPADISNFRLVSSAFGQIVVEWDAEDMAFSGGKYVIKHHPSVDPIEAVWNSPLNYKVEVGAKERKATLLLAEGTYMIKSKNLAGIESATEARIVVDLPDNLEYPVVDTIAEHTGGFAGTKTNMEVTSEGNLVLSGADLYDSESGLFDDKPGLFDAAGGWYTSGTYVYAGSFSFSNDFHVRLEKFLSANYIDSNDMYDDREGLFDSQTGFYDGIDTNTVEITHQFRSRRDGATFSEWQSMHVNDFVAKDIEFRILVSSEFNYQNVSFEELGVLLRMKRTFRGSNYSVPNTGATITFSKAFYEVPETVVANITNPQQGDYVVIDTITRAAFNVMCYDKNDNAVARNIYYQAYGIGEQE